MSKNSKPLILPRQPNAYWTFTVAKIIMLVILLVYIVFVVSWSFYTMQHFKDQIVKLNEKNPNKDVKSTSETIQYLLSARETQRLQTHRHFFLFTGLFLFGSSLIGLLAVAKEFTSLLLGFIAMQALSLGFEYVGAVKSNDELVMRFKTVSMMVSPVLILLAGMFVLMVRRLEEKASTQPTYRQTVVGGLPNISNGNAQQQHSHHHHHHHGPARSPSVKNVLPPMHSTEFYGKDYAQPMNYGGQVNLALNIDDERQN